MTSNGLLRPGQNRTKYFYDLADRLERTVAPLVADEIRTFNAFGEEKTFTAGAKEISRDYDELGRLKKSTWTNAYAVVEDRAYNGVGALASVKNGTLEKTAEYDVWLGTLSSETFKIGANTWKSQFHEFDRAKKYRKFTDPENGVHDWDYDLANRLWKAHYTPPGGQKKLVYELSYTPGGLVDTATCHDAAGQPIARTTYSYDGRGRKVRAQTLRVSTGETLTDFEWVFDDGDRVRETKFNHLGAKATYDYNNRDELTSEIHTGNGNGQTPPPDPTVTGGAIPANPTLSDPSDEATATPAAVVAVASRTATYVFDPGGNRTSQTIDGATTTFTHNAASQLTAQTASGRTVSHQYDSWGNEIERVTTEGTSKTETYGFNYLNLLSVYSNSSSPTSNTQYAYWPTGERYEKVTNGSPVEAYIPRAGDVAADYASGGALTATNVYVQGVGTDQKYLRITSTGTRRHYVGDQVGTVSVTLTDEAAVHEATLRDAWGVLLPGFNPTAERYGFAQREHDPESGLVHMRARQYDPAIGRFTQTDPVMGNRATKHYSYGLNQPTRFIDPTGLYEEDVHFYMSYFLARKNGLTHDQAFELAGAAQFVDDSPRTQPVRFGKAKDLRVLKKLHFAKGTSLTDKTRRNSPEANALFEKGLKDKDLTVAGMGLHLLQDSYAHEGFNIELNPLGHGGHNVFGVSPDVPTATDESRQKALEMGLRINERIRELAGELGIESTYSQEDAGEDLRGAFSAEKVSVKYDLFVSGAHFGTKEVLENATTKNARLTQWQNMLRKHGLGSVWYTKDEFEKKHGVWFDSRARTVLGE